jgi:hypothetical protein
MLRRLCTSVRSRLQPYGVVIAVALLVVWAAVMIDATADRLPALILAEEHAVVTWQHQPETGGILTITATVADASAQDPPMTLREWTLQLLEWFPNNVVEGN